jgi:hypothetical protein
LDVQLDPVALDFARLIDVDGCDCHVARLKGCRSVGSKRV